jgi:hypothetical protein
MQTCSVVRRSAPAPLCVTQTYCSAGPTNTLPIVSPTCLLTHPPTHLPTHPPTDAGLLLSSRGGLFRRQRGGVGTTGTARARGELRGRPTPDLTLLTTHYSLLTTHYSPLTTHHSPLTTHYSLPTTHYRRATRRCYYAPRSTRQRGKAADSPCSPSWAAVSSATSRSG